MAGRLTSDCAGGTAGPAPTLQQMLAAVARLQQSTAVTASGIDAALHEITETAAHGLGVRYASVWLYMPDRRTRCADLYDARTNRHEADFVLTAHQPDHFGNSTILAAADVRTVKLLMERPDVRAFLQARGVRPAMLVRLFNDGIRVGMLIVGDDSEPRPWTPEEQLFANVISAWTSQVLEQERRRLADLTAGQRDLYYQALMKHSSDGFTVVDKDGRVIFQSETSTRNLGYSPEELQTMKPLANLHPEDLPKVQDALAKSEPGDSGSFIIRLRHKDGSWRPFEIEARDLRHDPVIRGIVINARDVSRRLETEQRLRQAEKLEALGRLAGGVAHELNNMLHPILTFATACQERVEDPKLKDYLEIVLNSARSARNVVHHVQAFAQGRQQTDPKRSGLADAIGHAVREAESLLTGGMRLETDISVSGTVVLDQAGLTQVIAELVKNAVAASPPGSRIGVASKTVELTRGTKDLGLPPGVYAEIDVSDEGCGMAPEVRERVFEPFFTTKDVGQGRGLGLALAFGIVTGWKGTIGVESAPGQGSTFRILLPLTDRATGLSA